MTLYEDFALPELCAESARRAEVHPLAYEEDTAAQDRWIGFRGRYQLWRAANQVGKSRAQAKKVIKFLRAEGPFANRKPGPRKVLVISISKEQMEPLHSKFWELLPKDEIDPSVEYKPGYGFVGKPARVTFTSGPAKGCLIVFATYAQGAQRIEGGTYDIILLDEPPPEQMWSAVTSRLLHGRPGELWITFTATPQSPDLTYLREKVKEGAVIEMQTSLSVEAVTRRDGSRLLTQAKIDDFAATCLAIERDMRLHGGWDVIQTDRVLSNWGPHCVSDDAPHPASRLVVGTDHGTRAGRQASALLAVYQPIEEDWPRVWLLEEYVSDGFSTPEIDAQAILEMLLRRSATYDHVDVWVGDRATGMDIRDVRKSNKILRIALARLLRRREDDPRLKRIDTPMKRSGSVLWGYRMMNAVMGRKDPTGRSHFQVAPHCAHFQKSAAQWKGGPKDPLKDILDGARYGIEHDKVVRVGRWFPFHLYQ